MYVWLTVISPIGEMTALSPTDKIVCKNRHFARRLCALSLSLCVCIAAEQYPTVRLNLLTEKATGPLMGFKPHIYRLPCFSHEKLVTTLNI